MNKLFSKLKSLSVKGKKLYLFLLIIFIIGVIFGSVFLTILDENDKASVLNQVASFFNQIKANEINYLETLRNSMTANLLYITFVFILGISIIGIPIVIIMLFLKGFMIGFSLVTIIAQYKFIGVLGAITYIFPHIIISTLVILIISYYALNLSFNIFKAVIKKKTINFNEIINRYSFTMLFGVILMIISSLIETFISPYIIKFFLIFI
ncbi:MAG TPA: stage II sporulation protein M [Mollicutes bacterium]|nr:stage II sporulation protein M [Mollicutes bacterium]